MTEADLRGQRSPSVSVSARSRAAHVCLCMQRVSEYLLGNSRT